MPSRQESSLFGRRRALGGLAATLAAPSLFAQSADTFPAREIRLIVPWNAGGANDLAARLLSQILAEQGVKLVVDNVPGATGTIGMTRVANAEPDGYTVGMGTSSTLAAIAQGLTPLKNEQFAPIARVSVDPLVLLVHTSAAAGTIESFVAHVKRNPGKVSIGIPGTNNLNHVFAVMTGRVAGTDVISVPYTGGARVVVDLAGKQVEAAVLKPSESKAQIDAGHVKPIGVYANERLGALPDIPTFREKGFDVFPYGPLLQMSYLVAPAATPPAVVERLTTIFSRAIQTPRFRSWAESNGSVVDNLSGASLQREVVSVTRSLAEVGKKVFVPEKKS